MQTAVSSSRGVFGLAILVFFAIGCAAFVGQTIRLTCARGESGGPVGCVKETRLFWVIPFGEEEIHDVRGARQYVREFYCDGDECYAFYVELLTGQGSIKFDSGPFSSREEAERINAFVHGAPEEKLVVTGLGLQGFAETVFFNIVPVVIVYGLAIAAPRFWRKIKSAVGWAKPT